MTNIFLIKKPIISEKSTDMTSLGKYVFAVDKASSKNEIKKAIHALYKVDVVSVNTVRTQKRSKSLRGIKTSAKVLKKAIVTLKKGQTIDLT